MPIVEGDVCLSLMPDLLINDVQFQAGGCGIELGRLDKRLRGVWQDSNNEHGSANRFKIIRQKKTPAYFLFSSGRYSRSAQKSLTIQPTQ
jgi:hypothetical protein